MPVAAAMLANCILNQIVLKNVYTFTHYNDNETHHHQEDISISIDTAVSPRESRAETLSTSAFSVIPTCKWILDFGNLSLHQSLIVIEQIYARECLGTLRSARPASTAGTVGVDIRRYYCHKYGVFPRARVTSLGNARCAGAAWRRGSGYVAVEGSSVICFVLHWSCAFMISCNFYVKLVSDTGG